MRQQDDNSHAQVNVVVLPSSPMLDPIKKKSSQIESLQPQKQVHNAHMHFAILASGSILSAIGFSALQEWVFKIPGFQYGGWMTFITYVTFAFSGLVESLLTKSTQRNGSLRDYAMVSLLAMGGAYFTNWALTYLNYTTRIVFKSCRVLPVMGFRTLVVGQRYTWQQYGAGLLLVIGIALFSMGDAEGLPNFSWAGIALISMALVCDALTANLEERQFFRIKQPCTHAEVMLYLSTFAMAESFIILVGSGEIWEAIEHSQRHVQTVPCICAFSVLGYVTVSLILLIIKSYGATSAEIVKSLRKVCQVAVSFMLFPKVLSVKYVSGGLLVTLALYLLQRTGAKKANQTPVNTGSAVGAQAEDSLVLTKSILSVDGGPVRSRSPRGSKL